MAWSERPAAESIEARIRFNWIGPDGGFIPGNESGQALNSLPGSQYISDMVSIDDDQSFLVLYDEMNGSATQRLALQKMSIWGGPMWGGPGQETVTIAPPAPRFVGESRVILNDETKGGIIFWEEEPSNIFAQSVDSLGNTVWATHTHSVTQSGNAMSVGSDGENGAIVTWYGNDGALYATRVNESVAVRGDISVSTFVRRRANGVVEPISTARAVACPKGEEDELIFRVELAGQLMTPLPADALTLEWPPTTNPSGFRSFRAAAADSAMRLDGDRYRTTITLRELGGGGNDSVTVMANGSAVAKAPYQVISPDVQTSTTPGDVSLSDYNLFAMHYSTSAGTKPYSWLVDYMTPQGGVFTTRPDGVISLADYMYLQGHYGHRKPANLHVAGSRAVSAGRVVLSFSEAQDSGQRLLNVKVSLEDMEPFTVGYFSLRNENSMFEFSDWHQSIGYPYTTISAPAVRDGEKLVGILAVTGKNAFAWNGELGTVEMRVSSSAPIELADSDFALITGDILAASGEVLAVARRDTRQPRKLTNSLAQNYPNPFNPTTTISYSIANPGHVELTIYDVRGAVVKRLVNGERKPDRYHVVWDGTDNKGTQVASGVYFYRLRAPKFTMSKKMLLLK